MINYNLISNAQIKAPNKYDKYADPIDNLLHAILLRAMMDANGYLSDTTRRMVDGKDTRQFLETDGRRIYQHLKDAELTKEPSKDCLRARRWYAKKRSAYTGKHNYI